MEPPKFSSTLSLNRPISRDNNAQESGDPAAFWQTTLDSLNAHIAVLDGEGRILAVNAAWRRFASNNGYEAAGACIGVNYLAVCDGPLAGEGEVDSGAAAIGIRAVFAGKRKEFFLPYPCHSPVKKRWFMLRVTRFEGPGPAQVVIAHENITAPKAAQIRASLANQRSDAINAQLRRKAAELERAEALEAESNRILELIARNELIDTILESIALLVEGLIPGSNCAVISWQSQRTEIVAAPNFPEPLLDQLKASDIAARAQAGDQSLNQLVKMVGLSDAPLNTADPMEFRFVPIQNQSGTLRGWIAVTKFENDPAAQRSPVLTRAASLAAIAMDHASLYEKLSFQAGHDALTEIPNRLLFHERLQQSVIQARRVNKRFAVGVLKLDHFQRVNDLYGHQLGDNMLRKAARRVLDCTRPGDTVARLGGDEFAVLLDNLRNPEEAEQIASDIIMALQLPFSIRGQALKITGSLGFSLYPQDASDAASLVRNAETALDLSKRLGRNVFHRYDASMGLKALERLEIERHLRNAVEEGELEVHYQLQFDMKRRICGMEALVRWQNPVLGSVPPGKFIPIAEETGIIIDIGRFVLRRACLQSMEWQNSGHRARRIAVNVSTVQLIRAGFAEFVALVLNETGLDPDLLELEITESAMMANMQNVINELESLRKLGVRISIDDFGTGYSSLSYLQNLPVDTIKIDRTFICALDGVFGSGASVVRAIITLAHSLNLTVVAEGVELESQFDLLSELGCDVIQGYLLHRPESTAALTLALTATRPVSSFSPVACLV